MSVRDLYFPKQKSIQNPTNDFHWSLGAEPIYSDSTQFFYAKYPVTGEEFWVFSGGTGSVYEDNYFSFLFSVPYLDQDLLECTYKLGVADWMHVTHVHSHSVRPGTVGVRIVDADEAELTIRLDRTKGIVTGDFKATFKHIYRLAPIGTFKMTRTDVPALLINT